MVGKVKRVEAPRVQERQGQVAGDAAKVLRNKRERGEEAHVREGVSIPRTPSQPLTFLLPSRPCRKITGGGSSSAGRSLVAGEENSMEDRTSTGTPGGGGKEGKRTELTE